MSIFPQPKRVPVKNPEIDSKIARFEHACDLAAEMRKGGDDVVVVPDEELQTIVREKQPKAIYDRIPEHLRSLISARTLEIEKKEKADCDKPLTLRKEIEALEAWQNVAAESNRAVSAYLKEKCPSLDLEGGMPVDNVRKAFEQREPRSHLEVSGLSASEAVYGFCGWLTTQDYPTTMGASHDCGRIADLIGKFCKKNNLSEPRDDWQRRLEYPERLIEPEDQPPSPVRVTKIGVTDHPASTTDIADMKTQIVQTANDPIARAISELLGDSNSLADSLRRNPDSLTEDATPQVIRFWNGIQDNLVKLLSPRFLDVIPPKALDTNNVDILSRCLQASKFIEEDLYKTNPVYDRAVGNDQSYLNEPSKRMDELLNNKMGQVAKERRSCLERAEDLYDALRKIIAITNPDVPGVHEPCTLEKVNGRARGALNRPIVACGSWCSSYSDTPVSDEGVPGIDVTGTVEEALRTLSGELSYDNVAAAKQILKNLLD